jgi:hypothetical protein
MTTSWPETKLAERRARPSGLAVVAAIYVAGWVGSIVVTLVVRALGVTSLAGALAGSDLWWQLASALVAGIVLPHVVEAFTGEIISYGGPIIATLAGGFVTIALELVVGPNGLYVSGPLGYVLSLATIPALIVSY